MRWLLGLAALSGPVLPLMAQSRSFVSVGQAVRLRLPAGDGTFQPRFDGTIVGISGDTLTLRPKRGGGSRLYTPSFESQLMVLTEKRSALVRGGIIGGLAGVLAAGFVATLGGPDCNGDGVLCFIRRHNSARTAALLGGVGAAAGVIVGALSPQKTWTRAWLPEAPPGPVMEPARFRVGMSIRF
jgi:hypothetical protein